MKSKRLMSMLLVLTMVVSMAMGCSQPAGGVCQPQH